MNLKLPIQFQASLDYKVRSRPSPISKSVIFREEEGEIGKC